MEVCVIIYNYDLLRVVSYEMGVWYEICGKIQLGDSIIVIWSMLEHQRLATI